MVVRRTIAFDDDVNSAIENYRANQRPIPSFTDAVNELLRECMNLEEKQDEQSDEEK